MKNARVKDRLEIFSKLVPALTLICYASGFVVYNTYLAQYGITDFQIFSVKYIAAGLNFLFFIAFVIGTVYLWPLHLYTNKYRKLFVVLTNAYFAFYFYSLFFYDQLSWQRVLLSGLVVLFITGLFHICLESIKKRGLWMSDGHIWLFALSMASLFIFGNGYKYIKRNVGGGESYRKILVLEKNIPGLINLDSTFKTDTLSVIHENESYIYFVSKGKVSGIRRDLVIGEITDKK